MAAIVAIISIDAALCFDVGCYWPTRHETKTTHGCALARVFQFDQTPLCFDELGRKIINYYNNYTILLLLFSHQWVGLARVL